MSEGLLTVLTVVEIVALVVILAIYLLVVAYQLISAEPGSESSLS